MSCRPFRTLLLGLLVLFAGLSAAAQEGKYVLNEGFEEAAVPALPPGWAQEDTNADLNVWETRLLGGARGSSSARLMADATLGAADWLFTPALNLDAGVTYTFAVTTRATLPGSGWTLQADLATAPNGGALAGPVLPPLGVTTQDTVTVTQTFTVPTTGVWYIGLNGVGLPGEYALFVDEVRVAAPENDLALTLSLDQAAYEGTNIYSVGDPVRVLVQVENTGGAPVCMNSLMGVGDEADPDAHVSFLITGPGGAVPPRAKYELATPEEDDFADLAPGDAQFKNFDLNRGHFDLTVPGSYTVEAVYKNLQSSTGCSAWQGLLVSPAVAFEIQ